MSDQPPIVDDAVDQIGAEDAAARLVRRLEHVPLGQVRLAASGRELLWPPFSPDRDRVEGIVSARTTLVVFGAFGTPWSRTLSEVLAAARERARVAWRHFPDPTAHPSAAVLALAAEAAAARGRFWALTTALLEMRHDDAKDLHDALTRAGVDPSQALAAMRAATGLEWIADDVTSARASGVVTAPALFIDGERYHGEVDAMAVAVALVAAERS
jgi:protein-disulfide isomerase